MLSETELVKRFTIWDYAVFACMLLVSATIGLYYACSGGKQRTTSEFLMADRNMGIFPVSLSLLASFMSAVTLLGTPAEMYNFNASYWFIAIGYCFVIPITAYFYLPVFYRLRITSAYEYLERRFNKTIRRCGSLVFIVQMTIYMAIVLYAPALALSQVTGLRVWASVAAIGLVCTFYTTLGGMKAVMWTDAFQVFIMFGSIIAVVIKGCIDLGGIDIVWQRAQEGKRLEFFNFTPDPFIRHTFWSLTIGGTFTWLAVYGVNQAQVQRYLTTSTMKTAQRALWWNLVGLISLLSICCLAGLVMYAAYWNCDPITSNQIKLSDQLLPLFVMDIMGLYPGVPGFFVAGIFSGALSTVSSGMNSLAAVTLEDFVKSCCFPKMSDQRATLVSKILALFYGILCIALVAVAEQLGNVLQSALSIFGIVGGPLLGVFSLGIFFPCANSIGAGLGLLSGFGVTFWIAAGAQIYKNYIHLPKSPVSVAGCSWNNYSSLLNETSWVNETLSLVSIFSNHTTVESLQDVSTMASIANATTPSDDIKVLPIYELCYLWYSLVACITVIVVGLIVSLITGVQDTETLDPRLICPVFDKCCCCLPERIKRILRCGVKKMPTSPEIAMDTLKNDNKSNKIEKIGIDNPVFNGQDTITFKSANGNEYITPL